MYAYDLSIIIPVFNEARRLPGALDKLLSFLEVQKYSAEILVIENGSTDETFPLAHAYANRFTQLRLFQESTRGKGLAVKRGMLEARGEYRLMCDVDFSMPVEEINRFIPPNLTGYDIAIASRELPDSVRYNEPYHRHLIGRVFNQLIRALALPDFHDTQCGFKSFHAPIVEDIFSCQTIPGWTFDVEILYIANMRGYRIVEVPIPWYFNRESKVRIFNDSLNMARDLIAIRKNAQRGIYKKSNGKD